MEKDYNVLCTKLEGVKLDNLSQLNVNSFTQVSEVLDMLDVLRKICLSSEIKSLNEKQKLLNKVKTMTIRLEAIFDGWWSKFGVDTENFDSQLNKYMLKMKIKELLFGCSGFIAFLWLMPRALSGENIFCTIIGTLLCLLIFINNACYPWFDIYFGFSVLDLRKSEKILPLYKRLKEINQDLVKISDTLTIPTGAVPESDGLTGCVKRKIYATTSDGTHIPITARPTC